jgi:hypothetical protein
MRCEKVLIMKIFFTVNSFNMIFFPYSGPCRTPTEIERLMFDPTCARSAAAALFPQISQTFAAVQSSQVIDTWLIASLFSNVLDLLSPMAAALFCIFSNVNDPCLQVHICLCHFHRRSQICSLACCVTRSVAALEPDVQASWLQPCSQRIA